jgi:fatty acid desaturase
MALSPFVALALAAAVTNVWVLSVPWVAVSVPTVVATMLHPTGRHLFRSLGVSRVDRVLLALVVVAAGPLLVFAWTNIGLQRAGPTDHALLGHYGSNVVRLRHLHRDHA